MNEREKVYPIDPYPCAEKHRARPASTATPCADKAAFSQKLKSFERVAYAKPANAPRSIDGNALRELNALNMF